MLKDLSDDEFELLYTSISEHNGGFDFGDPTIDACADADRLDLVRFGISLDPELMSTEKGKEIALQN